MGQHKSAESPRVASKLAKFQNEPKTVQHYTSGTNQYQSYASQNHSNLNQDQSKRIKQPKKVWCVKKCQVWPWKANVSGFYFKQETNLIILSS